MGLMVGIPHTTTLQLGTWLLRDQLVQSLDKPIPWWAGEVVLDMLAMHRTLEESQLLINILTCRISQHQPSRNELKSCCGKKKPEVLCKTSCFSFVCHLHLRHRQLVERLHQQAVSVYVGPSRYIQKSSRTCATGEGCWM